MDEDGKPKDVDKGWAWVTLASCLVINIITCYENYSSGVLQVQLLQRFQEGNTATGLVASIFGGAMCVSGPFVGMLVNITSCRVTIIFGGILMTIGTSLAFVADNMTFITITYGLIAGIGCGFAHVPSYVIIGYRFDRYRGLAAGVNVAGGGIGMILSGPFTQYLLDTYGLSGTYLIKAGIASQLIVAGVLMRPSHSERVRHEGNDKQRICSVKNIFHMSLLKHRSFLLFQGSVFLYYAASNVIFINLPNFAVAKGSSEMEASVLMLQVGIGSTFSRLLSGVMTSRKAGLDPFMLSVGCLGLSALLTLTFPLYSSQYWQQSLFSTLFGIYDTALIGYLYFVCLAIVGIKRFPSAYGLIFLNNGTGYLIGPTVTGYLIDATGYHEVMFYFSGLCFTSAIFLLFLSFKFLVRDEEKEEKEGENSHHVRISSISQ